MKISTEISPSASVIASQGGAGHFGKLGIFLPTSPQQTYKVWLKLNSCLREQEKLLGQSCLDIISVYPCQTQFDIQKGALFVERPLQKRKLSGSSNIFNMFNYCMGMSPFVLSIK